MKRRKFLAIAGIGGLLASIVSLRFVTTSFEETLEKQIIDELHFLKIDGEGVRRFVRDYTKATPTANKFLLKSYAFMGVTSQQSRKINNLISTYLLSSDFFTNRMDETRTIRYVGLYDPHLRPCANPFASAYYSHV